MFKVSVIVSIHKLAEHPRKPRRRVGMEVEQEGGRRGKY
jgi:hypothetical protein